MTDAPSCLRCGLAEVLGTAGLLAVVTGSGIMAQRLCGDSVGLALLANSLATGGGLLALILAFGGISGAHFNPAVTVLIALRGDLAWSRVPLYLGAQILGGVLGVILTHGMFDLPLVQASTQVRSGTGQWLSEIVATCGLLMLIIACVRHHRAWTPAAVAAYVTAGYWFTSSTCFANPAVSFARAWTDTFVGIRPADVSGFILAEGVGVILAWGLLRVLEPVARVPSRPMPSQADLATASEPA